MTPASLGVMTPAQISDAIDQMQLALHAITEAGATRLIEASQQGHAGATQAEILDGLSTIGRMRGLLDDVSAISREWAR